MKSKDEAKEYCSKYGIVLSAHKSVIVTANGSIYLDTEKVDPSDTSERFVLKGKEEVKEIKVEEVKKQPSKK
jgi:hypothetical protein